MSVENRFLRFWAKTTKDDQPGISVLEHMFNVGYVAQKIAETTPKLLDRFTLSLSQVGAITALHDLGKISPGFQRKCEAWLISNDLQSIDRNWCWDKTTESSHAKTTHSAVQTILGESNLPRSSTPWLATILGAHHGRLQATPTPRPYIPNGISERNSGIDWDNERKKAVAAILTQFTPDLSNLNLDEHSPALWWLAGLTTIADWVGSDEHHFPAEGGMDEFQRSVQAKNSVSGIGFGMPTITCGLQFAELFGFPSNAKPNPMQIEAFERIQGPGIYVIEAPMGMGKTEAALWVAYKLLESEKACGIYFALPTQATSNRIHLRMDTFVKKITSEETTTRLIHGSSWLMDQSVRFQPGASGKGMLDDARLGYDWFASAKRAIISPFGVGTIDQALLGIVAAKHFFVRQFALAGKVVILDEVHSYDLYTGTLIDKLVGTLKNLGCTVIILSATLTGKRRRQFVPYATDLSSEPASSPYPLISCCPEGLPSFTFGTEAPPPKQVSILFEEKGTALSRAIEIALQGGVVLWICNTVATAQDLFAIIKAQAVERFPIGLLHSRFPFWRREELEEECMDRIGKSGETRCGCILVSTQIVEQSVDLDADLLITELAPTDMLLQRVGRLWRHERASNIRPIKSPQMIILEESQSLDQFRHLEQTGIMDALGSKAYVYSPYVLLRSLEVWKNCETLTIPNQIRAMIEATYEERATGVEPESWGVLADPESWGRLFDNRFATDCSKRFKATRATNLWQPALEDEEGVQTRLNEQPTIQIVLCTYREKNTLTLLNGETIQINTELFQLPFAQALHKNLVKLPLHHFESIAANTEFNQYLHGQYLIGLVVDGNIQVTGLKQETRIRWSLEEGVIIEKNSLRSQE